MREDELQELIASSVRWASALVVLLILCAMPYGYLGIFIGEIVTSIFFGVIKIIRKIKEEIGKRRGNAQQ